MPEIRKKTPRNIDWRENNKTKQTNIHVELIGRIAKTERREEKKATRKTLADMDIKYANTFENNKPINKTS